NLEGVESVAAAQAVVEGTLLASYRFAGAKNDPPERALQRLALVAGQTRFAGAGRGVARGEAIAGAACLARDLANTPPKQMTAEIIAERAVALGAETGVKVEVFNKDQLVAMGCGGIVGVNGGSVEPPRMVRL